MGGASGAPLAYVAAGLQWWLLKQGALSHIEYVTHVNDWQGRMAWPYIRKIGGPRRKRVTLIAKSPENCAGGQGSVSTRGWVERLGVS